MHSLHAYCQAVLSGAQRFNRVFVVFGLIGVAGCIPAPPVSSPLPGFWEFDVPGSDAEVRLLLEFNDEGGATTVIYQIGEMRARLDESPTGQTTVTDATVSVDLAFGDNAFNLLVFTGELSAEGQTITGTATLQIREGGTTVNLQEVEATLTAAADAGPVEPAFTGTWEYFPGAEAGESELRQLLLVFDENDSPVRVIYKTDENPTVIDEAPSGLVSVAEDAATLFLEFTGGTVLFEGTFEAEDELAGEITVALEDGDTTIGLAAQPATLLRVVAPEEPEQTEE